MSNLGDLPAFPHLPIAMKQDGKQISPIKDGMTFRQYAAVHLMQGLLANGPHIQAAALAIDAKPAAFCSLITNQAIRAADALIAELEKPQ